MKSIRSITFFEIGEFSPSNQVPYGSKKLIKGVGWDSCIGRVKLGGIGITLGCFDLNGGFFLILPTPLSSTASGLTGCSGNGIRSTGVDEATVL